MHHHSIIAAVVCFAVLGYLMPRGLRLINWCELIVENLQPAEISRMKKHLRQESHAFGGPAFWQDSAGVRGLRKRTLDMTLRVQLCQVLWLRGNLETDELMGMVNLASICSLYTLLAFPEALLCSLWRSLPHVCANAAYEAYAAVALRSLTLCTAKDAPMCVNKLTELL